MISTRPPPAESVRPATSRTPASAKPDEAARAREAEAFWKVGGNKKEWVIDAKHGIAVRPFIQGPGVEVVSKTEKIPLGRGYAFDMRLKVDADLLEAGVKIEKDLAFKFRGEDFRMHVCILPEAKIGADGELWCRMVVRPIRPTASLEIQGMAGAQATLGTDITLFANGKKLSESSADVFCNVGPVFGQSTKIGLTHFHQRRLFPMGAYTMGYELEVQVNPGRVLMLLPELANPRTVEEIAQLEREGKLTARAP